MTTENTTKIIFLILASVFSFFARLLPHTPNFAPIGALAIMSGSLLPKKYAFFLPLIVMLASDYFIGFYEIKIMLSVYLSFLLYVVLGNFLGKNENFRKLTVGTFFGALLFFLITNFAVWAFSPWYSKDISGLLLSYTLALPFFKNTILGDLFYTLTFFVVYQFALKKSLYLKLALSKPPILVNIK
jgi:hypothetical protein